MKNRLKMELDNRLSAVNWHGESKVWSQIHSKSTTERRIGRRSAILAAAVLMVFSVSAVAAFMLQYSPQQDMRMQAHSALNAEYGMTEEVVALFNETVTVDGSEWEANYELPVYGELAGSYSVVCENGKIDVLWSHDGETYSPDGDLSSAVWGVPQLVRMQKLYQTRTAEIAHWEENGGYDTLSIAQKAEIDAPLLELPYSVDSIHIMPSEDDIQQDKAEMLAREEILRRFGGDATALDNCEIRITFMQTNEARRYDLRFLMDGQVHYHVQLLSPTGQIVECRRFDWQGLTTDEAETLDDTAMSIEDRAALHEQMRKDGGDMQRWNSVLPEDGDINEAEAIHIAQEALHEQFGISAENLAGMDKEIYCRMDYECFNVPTKVWWIRYVDNIDDYQVMLYANSGVVESISNQGIGFGVG